MFTEEQHQKLTLQCLELIEKLNEVNAERVKASQLISDQAALIEQLSKDNLTLVAKLDALTGKKAPGIGFAA